MARSGVEVYGGAWGRTRTEPVLFTCSCGACVSVEVHRAVNATRDALLGQRARAGEIPSATCPVCQTTQAVAVPLVYHDEERRLFVLVLPPALRHRELEERAELLLAIARDRIFAVPPYVVGFDVVYGPPGLVERLARPAAVAVAVAAAPPAPDAEELHALEMELTGRRAALQELEAELATRAAALDEREQALAQRPAEKHAELHTFVAETMEKRDEHAARARAAQTDRPRRPSERPKDALVERWAASGTPTGHAVDKGRARLFARLDPEHLEPFLAGAARARVQLHRLPTYPLVAIAVAAADGVEPLVFHLDVQRAADRTLLGALGQDFRATLDLFDADDLPVVQRELVEPLAANVRHVVARAEELIAAIAPAARSFEAAVMAFAAPGYDRVGARAANLDEDSFSLTPTAGAVRVALGVVGGWSEPANEDYLVAIRSFPLDWWRRIRARVLVRAVELGLALPESLLEAALAEGLGSKRRDLAQRLLAAFADHASELDAADVRENWKNLVAFADAQGVPVDGRAAELAGAAGVVSDSGRVRTIRPATGPIVPPASARSTTSAFGPPDGGPTLEGAFATVVSAPAPRPVSRAVTLSPKPQSRRAGATTGASGAIVQSPTPAPQPVRSAPSPVPVPARASSSSSVRRRDFSQAPLHDLLILLDDKDVRRDAALELCTRGDAQAVGPVFGALRRMTRGEAVRVFPLVIKFGERAVPHLVDGLRSRKAYLRQGCALALGVLKSSEGIEPLCDLLLSEPTDVWREIARAIGEIGPGAVMSLAARIREVRDGDLRDRVSWALAHVAARGGRAPVEALAGGRDTIAGGAARRALELAGQARDNDNEVKTAVAPREVTVNRAFSRRFFEVMNRDRARVGEITSDAVLLDSGDLEEEDDEELLGEDDLIPE